MRPAAEDLGIAFERLRESLHGYLRRHLPDSALADDLLQEVFVKALAAKHAGRRIDNLTGWLYAVTRTTLADHYRSGEAPAGQLGEEGATAEEEDLRMHQQLSKCLRPFVGQLGPIYRDTLIATELEGSSMRAIAEAEGVSVSAIKSRAARGRAMLKHLLLECCTVELDNGYVSDYRSR